MLSVQKVVLHVRVYSLMQQKKPGCSLEQTCLPSAASVLHNSTAYTEELCRISTASQNCISPAKRRTANYNCYVQLQSLLSSGCSTPGNRSESRRSLHATPSSPSPLSPRPGSWSKLGSSADHDKDATEEREHTGHQQPIAFRNANPISVAYKG